MTPPESNLQSAGAEARGERSCPRRAGPGHRALRTLARETGGASYFPRPGDLKSVYRSIATELANQYSIGYIPADERDDGRFRRIVVQVLTGNALRSRTRLGYVAVGDNR